MALSGFIAVSTMMMVFILKSISCHEFYFDDKDHLQEHVSGELDLSFVSAADLQFLYFQSHDAEANNKLDGCELVQSLLHFHTDDNSAHGQTTKVFTDAELSMMVDPLLDVVDVNKDGFIDFPEFLKGIPAKNVNQKCLDSSGLTQALSAAVGGLRPISYHKFYFDDKGHLQENMSGELDLSFVSAADPQFLYFQSHDAKANNKQDCYKLVQSLLHFHSDDNSAHGQTIKVFRGRAIHVGRSLAGR